MMPSKDRNAQGKRQKAEVKNERSARIPILSDFCLFDFAFRLRFSAAC
jgi:hypothetical protein